MAKNNPMLFGKPMRRRATGDFVLLVAKLQLRVSQIGYAQRWTFSLLPRSASGLGGHLMSEQDYDSAERAAAGLELMLSEQVIALVTELRNGARTAPAKARRTKAKRARR
jgi:hypothetical protein